MGKACQFSQRHLFTPCANSGGYDASTDTYTGISESEVVAPSDMMAIGDSFDHGMALVRRTLADLGQFSNLPTRHEGRVNVLLCDGHIESPTLKFVFEDTTDAALSRWNRDHLPHRDRL
jgi:prepilin-type processing-associated H-X9-DG protein